MSSNNEIGEKHRNMNPNSLLNLRPAWRPGVSPNPGGVKKGQVFVSEAYKRLLCLNPQELAEYAPANVAEAIALRQVVSGIYGQDALPSAKEITDRTEGKAPQKVTLEQIPYDEEARIEAAIDYMRQQNPELKDREQSELEAVVKAAFSLHPEFRDLGKVG